MVGVLAFIGISYKSKFKIRGKSVMCLNWSTLLTHKGEACFQ